MVRFLEHGIWPPADPALVDAGREGEAAVARARIVILVMLLASPVATLARNPGETPALLALVLDAVFIAVSFALLKLTARRGTAWWLGFATSAADITYVTLYHAFIFASGYPAMAFGSRATFALYLVAITATSLRQDRRIATIAGLLAAIEWLALIAWAQATGYAAAASEAGRFYGETTLSGQAEELVVFAVMTMLARMIVGRAAATRLSSVRDSLTGLLSRAHFEERLTTELIRGERQRRPLALAVIDLDGFKRINDTYGHPSGDIVLREVAARLTRGVRRTDLSARIGGDEFALVFVDTNVADAAIKLEEIRAAVAAHIVRLRNEQGVTVTLSAGVAVAPLDGTDVETLVAAADARLLIAKQLGRNRLVVSDDRLRVPVPRSAPDGSWNI
jgi:diguanylate cyclase (GGDEF)-like protein